MRVVLVLPVPSGESPLALAASRRLGTLSSSLASSKLDFGPGVNLKFKMEVRLGESLATSSCSASATGSEFTQAGKVFQCHCQ